MPSLEHAASLPSLLVLFSVLGSAQNVGFTAYPIPTPNSYPTGIAAGPDGALWFTEHNANKIGRITPAGVITEYTPTSFGLPVGIATGPDGAMWFTEESSNKIGRITVAGVITEYDLPDDGNGPTAITAGPDGALWFRKGNSFEQTVPIGRITTAGVATDYPASTSTVGGITAGPDGAVWFADWNKIRRITTYGVITGYPIPASQAQAYGITTGPDGALWFGVFADGSGEVGRITTSGAITEYPLPTAGTAPIRIATGPDGALWFTEEGQIGRITTAGVIAEYLVPIALSGVSGGFPGSVDIAAGPDGALWFTSPGGNSIVRAQLNVGPPAVTGETPSAGSGTTQTFTFQFSHPSGYENLGVVDILINNALDGRRACYLAYAVRLNTLYLVDDGGDPFGPFAGSAVLGRGNTVRNSQCTVGLTSASGNGTTLTLTVSIIFQPGFAGNQIAYLSARDLGTGNSGWQPMGVWQVPSPPPGTIAVSGLSGTTPPLSVTFTDSKGTSDLGVVNLLINSFVDGRTACYLAYLPPINALILVDDAGDAAGPYAGSMPLNGQSAAIGNSQCSVSAMGSSVAYSGNSMTLTLSVTFQPAFHGNRVIYAAARDLAGGNNTGWQAVAAGTVQ